MQGGQAKYSPYDPKRDTQRREIERKKGIKQRNVKLYEKNGAGTQCDHRTLQPSHSFLTDDRTFIPLRCCCWITFHESIRILRAGICEFKDRASEVEKNCLLEEMPSREVIALEEEERRRSERRARGALRMDTGIMRRSVLVSGISEEGEQK